MLQRNDTHYPYTFTSEPVHAVLPGETADHPVLLDGWTSLEPELPEAEPVSDAEPVKSKARRAAAAGTDGGELL